MSRNYKYVFILPLIILAVACNNDDEPGAPQNPNTTIIVDGKNWTFEPTINDIIYPIYFPEPTVKKITEEKFQLGRHLFYETKLSRNNTISCGSCHVQEKAFTDGRRFSVGLNGENTPRNAMSLTNMLWEDKLFWDGRSSNLEHQALMPIQDHIEMDLTLGEAITRLQAINLYDSLFFHAFGDTMITAPKIAEAIAEFERGLISTNSKFDKFKRGEASLTMEEQLGSQMFTTHPGYYYNPTLELSLFIRGGNCGDCHTSVLFNGLVGNQGMVNNGLEFDDTRKDDGFFNMTQNPNDKGKFKAPSLRNIALTAPYMHDGRFTSLKEVLDHYNDHVKVSSTLSPLMFVNNDENQQGIISPDGNYIQLGLTESEKNAIIAFLNTLTDEEFINNKRFSNPFSLE